MTRDEAIEILGKHVWPGSSSYCPSRQWIDALSELGMLKLDEPKSPQCKLKEYLTAYGYGSLAAEDFLNDIDAAGLKIVEK